MLYSVIIAGGSGTRLWPLSRQSRPKQLLDFGGGRSLLQQSVDRLAPLVPAQRTLIVTHRDYIDAIAEQAPELPAENLLGEPAARNTAAALGWAAQVLAARDPDAVMTVITADHVIKPKATLQSAVDRAAEVVRTEPETLVTFGVKPRSPHTGFGYLHLGDRLAGDGTAAFRLLGFREKPNRATAESFLAGGRHLWNSGMFCWRAGTLRSRLAACRPALAAGITEYERLRAGGDGEAADRVYANLEKISIDYAVMEPAAAAGAVRCVELDLEWHDVGSFDALSAVLESDAQGNVCSGSVDPVLIDARNNVVVSEDGHTIALIGVDDLVVVRTPDATLVCRRRDAERVKDAVELLKKSGRDKTL